ncbi:MAG: ABC transporter substrate-binding protein [Xanthobacteraceae bacterium]
MQRRQVVRLFGSAAAWPLTLPLSPLQVAAAEQARVRHVGILMSFPAADPDARERIASFEQGMRELGWSEGRNLRLDRRFTAGDPVELRRHADDLLRLAPDVILANSTPATLALKEQGAQLPVVFTQVTDPIGAGVVASLARPATNFTGFTSFEFSIGTKWLEMLKVVAPNVSRVALVFNPKTAPFAELFWGPVEAAAGAFDARAVRVAVDGRDMIEAIETFAREPNGGLMVMPDITTMNLRAEIVALAARHLLPSIYPFRYFAVSGGLISYGTDVADVFRRAAGYVDRVLKGARPSELPVQAPTKLELVMNVKAAKALGITMPPLLLARADEVLE